MHTLMTQGGGETAKYREKVSRSTGNNNSIDEYLRNAFKIFMQNNISLRKRVNCAILNITILNFFNLQYSKIEFLCFAI